MFTQPKPVCLKAEINIAEGKKKARIFQSEAEKQELINAAMGSAQAVIVAGEARAKSIELVSQVMHRMSHKN